MPPVYLDNAATTWPKPEAVYAAMDAFARNVGSSPGRSGHRRAVEAGRIVLETRLRLARLFNAPDPFGVLFTKNATEALNLALLGLLVPGDHVVTSGMEHNAVMRPLRELERQGVNLTVVPSSPRGLLDPGDLRAALHPTTRAIVLTAASNVLGALTPLAEVGALAAERDIVFIVDAAQAAGAAPLDVQAARIDLLAFTGHKALYGPPGTGGLCLRPGMETRLRPLMRGGTGSRSEEEEQPDFLPDRFESGTLNAVGLAGLGAGVEMILDTGVAAIREKEIALTQRFLDGLQDIEGATIYGPREAARRTALVSFNLKGRSPSDVAQTLDEEFGILCRPGLHCAPAAHRTAGTFSGGAVRFGFGLFNAPEEIDAALDALRILARRGTP